METFICKKCGKIYGWVLEGILGCCAYCTEYPDGTKTRVREKSFLKSTEKNKKVKEDTASCGGKV